MNNYITTESEFDEIRRKNFFFYSFIALFVWMCFHFTLVFFFLLELRSPLFVWIFLGLWNLVAFFADSPVWVLQKYFDPKKIFIFWASLMFFVSLIFLFFVYETYSLSLTNVVKNTDFSLAALQNIMGSFLNIILLLVAVLFYWIIKELNDVTSLSYIMNNADPSEYADLLSKNNIFAGLWAMTGLIISGIILSFNILAAVVILVILIVFFIFFIVKYFDSSENHIEFRDIQKLKYITKESVINSINEAKTSFNEYSAKMLNKDEILQKAKEVKVLFLKPIEMKNSVDWNDVYLTAKLDIHHFFEIIFQAPYNYRLLVMWAILTLFWFWDTFVTSFLIDFLEQIISINSETLKDLYLQNIMTAYVFIALLAIPAYWAQLPLINLWNKIWVMKVILAWVLISGISVFLFGFFNTLWIVLILGLLNSIWYAAAMPTAQWEFSTEYNNTYAQKMNLSKIDSNARAAPLKMLLNLANVLGLFVWWMLVAIFGYSFTFLIFGAILIAIFIASIVKGKEWKL